MEIDIEALRDYNGPLDKFIDMLTDLRDGYSGNQVHIKLEAGMTMLGESASVVLLINE